AVGSKSHDRFESLELKRFVRSSLSSNHGQEVRSLASSTSWSFLSDTLIRRYVISRTISCRRCGFFCHCTILSSFVLQLFADDKVTVSDGNINFGVMCTPGACAAKLQQEVLHAVTTCQLDAVCVLAPLNNLTASINRDEAGWEFEQYLLTVCSRFYFPLVFCTGMVPQYHRRSAKLGIPFYPIADDINLGRHELCDDHGMPILNQLMWIAAYQFVEKSEPKIVPCVVVKGVERPPPPPSSEWTTVTSGRKVRVIYICLGTTSCHSSKKRVVPDKMDGTPVALKECYIKLNPVSFSADMLVVMEKVSPSALGDVHTGNETKPVEHPKKPAVSRTRRVRQQVCKTVKRVKLSEHQLERFCNVFFLLLFIF
uniref:Uncharacterized protein n=1 Tax=Kryptolebias marmoratus TaxID=37003 RepID=A0A3Q2ZSZ9_KRYMA